MRYQDGRLRRSEKVTCDWDAVAKGEVLIERPAKTVEDASITMQCRGPASPAADCERSAAM